MLFVFVFAYEGGVLRVTRIEPTQHALVPLETCVVQQLCSSYALFNSNIYIYPSALLQDEQMK